MKILFVASVAVVSADPTASAELYVTSIGLPLPDGGDGYRHSEDVEGLRHFGIWPLDQAATACFGTSTWPTEVPRPQASIEFEVDDVPAAAAELTARGHRLLHDARTEPWGQTVARLLSPEGLIVGVCHTPWQHP
jgi:catechol 2,3-dioxygenase-like lactoylglutathione lyase family enzyme